MFISYEFILFLLVLFAVYYVIPKRFQWILLLIANFLFYYSAGAFYPLFILATSVTVWFAGVCIDRQEGQWQSYQAEIKAGKIEKPSRDEKKAVKAKIGGKKKRIMLVCLLFNLGILAVLKYTNFVIDNVNTVLDAAGRTELPYADLILPLGISFYTFQAVAYLLDVYWGKCSAQKNLPRFILFVSFFPQLIQGPISRYGDLSQTLYAKHSFDGKQVRFGLERILWGYFKKLVIADRLSGAISMLMGDPEYYTGAYKTEWEFLRDVLMKNGVPREAILREDQATFTYENAIYSRQVTDREHLNIQKAILCCKACHARRALMYYKMLYPDTDFFVCSCCVDSVDKSNWSETNEGIDEVMGEMTRIIKQFSVMLKKN